MLFLAKTTADFSFFYFFRLNLFGFTNTFPMEKININGKTFKTFIPYSDIVSAIEEVSEKINADFEGTNEVPILLCVLNGSIMFMGELMKRLRFDCQIVSIKLSSYDGTKSTGNVRQALGLTSSIVGKKVIVVEDIVDSGNTVVELKKILAEAGAEESYICTMLFKPEAYKQDLKLDYVAMEIPNDFIVGFGLDYDEIGRNYKDIYVLEQ